MPEFARRNAAARPDEAALTDPSRSIGWADLDVMLNQVANAVRAVDLGPNHRVAVFAENAAETALAHLGGLLGGASTVPVNFHLIADEAGYVLRDSTARILFVGPETVERGLAAVDGSEVHTIVGWGLPPTPGVVAGNELDVAQQSVEAQSAGLDAQRANIQAQRSSIDALRSKKLAVEAEAVAVLAVWSAVDVEDHRQLANGRVRRPNEDAVHLRAVLALRRETLRRCELQLSKERVILV